MASNNTSLQTGAPLRRRMGGWMRRVAVLGAIAFSLGLASPSMSAGGWNDGSSARLSSGTASIRLPLMPIDWIPGRTLEVIGLIVLGTCLMGAGRLLGGPTRETTDGETDVHTVS
jgi:hypothetical protein